MADDLRLAQLRLYPGERMRELLKDLAPPAGLRPIDMSIGEPRHPPPAKIVEAIRHSAGNIQTYPATAGTIALRQAIAGSLANRFALADLDAQSQVLPTLGSREALFAIVQALTMPGDAPVVVCPNPFYQIYEGAALLAGASIHPVPSLAVNGFRCGFDWVPEATWRRTRILFVCSPGNPTGNVLTMDEWERLFELSDRFGFVVVADECYSEIYFDEGKAPLGALQAAARLGRGSFERLISIGSLSKRSSVPGLRSGYCAGNSDLVQLFWRYRTYHGSAMSPMVQEASIAAWSDEAHVVENRKLYREKFDAFERLLAGALPLRRPEAAFYYWLPVPRSCDGDDERYAIHLWQVAALKVLPGRYLSREVGGLDPGKGYVRLALVASMEETIDAAQRLQQVSLGDLRVLQ